MKLLLENWRKYLKEDRPQYDFEKQLLEEGEIWDFIKDSATAAAKLKEKIYDEALKQSIETYQKVTDITIPVRDFIQQYIPKPAQEATKWALSLSAAAKGKPKLAQRIASGKPTALKALGLGVGATITEEQNETPT
tara:strand:- start:211 stop:618 length:408 start_codon:yes stop_codon:yes gene_type:complete